MGKRTVLITGASGFIGRYLVKALARSRKYTVRSFVRTPVAGEYVLGSIEDKDAVRKATKGVACVIHLAGETRSSDKKVNYRANVKGTEYVIAACKENKVSRLIFAGTVNAALRQRGEYGEAKRRAEMLVRESGLEYVIVKLNMVYGVGDHGLSKTIGLVQKLPVIPIIGNGKGKLQPVYVEDVVDAIVQCIEKKNVVRKTYNIAGPTALTFDEYINIVLESLRIRKPMVHIPAWMVRMLLACTGRMLDAIITKEIVGAIVQDKTMDISAAQHDLGFHPKDLRVMLPRIVQPY